MTDRELFEKALEALEYAADHIGCPDDDDAIGVARKALRERLAQPEQEPVANIRIWHKNGEQHAELWNWDKGIETLPDGNYDLYTAPPQRKPLTDEEIEVLAKKHNGIYYDCDITFARAIEAAHGIKENT
jgi:hypothetical protein